MARQDVIAVIGGADCSDDISDMAQAVGREIARRGAALICGGRGGVMTAACRGAKEEGGMTIGVLPGSDRSDANEFVDVAIATGMTDARNVIIARSADAAIAIDGSYGTLSEIAFCRKFEVPVIGLRTWAVDDRIIQASGPAQAVELAFSRLQALQ